MPKPRKAQVLLEESNETDTPNGYLERKLKVKVNAAKAK
jgi:hypothetical protein